MPNDIHSTFSVFAS